MFLLTLLQSSVHSRRFVGLVGALNCHRPTCRYSLSYKALHALMHNALPLFGLLDCILAVLCVEVFIKLLVYFVSMVLLLE